MMLLPAAELLPITSTRAAQIFPQILAGDTLAGRLHVKGWRRMTTGRRASLRARLPAMPMPRTRHRRSSASALRADAAAIEKDIRLGAAGHSANTAYELPF